MKTGGRIMKKVDLIVSASHFYTMEGEGVGYKGNTSMAIDRGRIVAIGNTKITYTQSFRMYFR